MRLLLITGLPGSGKTRLAQTLARDGGVVIDDISVDTQSKITETAPYIIVTDPHACTHDPVTVMDRLREWFGDREIDVWAFKNDPQQCWENIQGRDDRVISRASIEAMSKQYHSDWRQKVPVWRPRHIMQVAIRTPSGVKAAPAPLRHGYLLNRSDEFREAECGFIDPRDGGFLTRDDAWQYAESISQPISGHGGCPGKLFSEDLW